MPTNKTTRLLNTPVAEIDDPDLVRLFLDLETSIDEATTHTRIEIASALLTRVIGQGRQGFENQFYQELEHLLFQLPADARIKKTQWQDLTGLLALRLLELGDLDGAHRAVSLVRAAGLTSEHAELCGHLLAKRFGYESEWTGTVSENFGRPDIPDLEHFHRMTGEIAVPGQPRRCDPFGLTRWVYQRGVQRDPYIKTVAYIYLVGCGLGKSHIRIQSPKNIRRQGLGEAHLHPQIQLIFDIASAIERAEDHQSAGAMLIDAQQIMTRAGSLVDAGEYLAVTLALRSLCNRHEHSWYASILQRTYEELSSKLTAGMSSDYLGILGFEEAEQRRSGKAIALTGQIASKWVALRAKNLFSGAEQVARQKAEFIDYVSELLHRNLSFEGGLFQKILQLGSGISGAIPVEIRDILANSCYQSKPMSAEQLKEITITFSGETESRIRNFNDHPFACGSIAQLHTASVENEQVVVKIKRGRIEKQIDQEFQAIRKWTRIGESLLPGSDLEATLADWRSRLLLECDMVHERRAHEAAFKLLNIDRPGYLKVPQIMSGLSTEHYTVQELIKGSSFTDFLDWSNQKQRNLAGSKIVSGYMLLNLAGLYYMDIHQGNFLFQPDDVWLIDFGGVIFRNEVENGPEYLETIRDIETGNRKRITEHFEKFGIIKDPTAEEYELLYVMHRDYLVKPFLSTKPFKFTPQFATDTVQFQIKASRKIGRLKFPRGANQGSLRFFWSLYALLGELGAEANWREILEDAAASTPKEEKCATF